MVCKIFSNKFIVLFKKYQVYFNHTIGAYVQCISLLIWRWNNKKIIISFLNVINIIAKVTDKQSRNNYETTVLKIPWSKYDITDLFSIWWHGNPLQLDIPKRIRQKYLEHCIVIYNYKGLYIAWRDVLKMKRKNGG